ncbi:unnamed protein product, partial [Urochloa humidicola]
HFLLSPTSFSIARTPLNPRLPLSGGVTGPPLDPHPPPPLPRRTRRGGGSWRADRRRRRVASHDARSHRPPLAPHLPSLRRAATADARAGASCSGCDSERWWARMRRPGMDGAALGPGRSPGRRGKACDGHPRPMNSALDRRSWEQRLPDRAHDGPGCLPRDASLREAQRGITPGGWRRVVGSASATS